MLLRAQDPLFVGGGIYIGSADLAQWYGDVEFGEDARTYMENASVVRFYGEEMIINEDAEFYSAAATQVGTGNIIF